MRQREVESDREKGQDMREKQEESKKERAEEAETGDIQTGRQQQSDRG